MLKLVKLIAFLLFYFTRAAVHVKRVEMMDKVNHTATSDVDKPADFSMQILTSQTQPEIEMVSVSYGLDRSISNSVERNSKASEMDLYQVIWMRTARTRERGWEGKAEERVGEGEREREREFYYGNLIYDTCHVIHGLHLRKLFVFFF